MISQFEAQMVAQQAMRRVLENPCMSLFTHPVQIHERERLEKLMEALILELDARGFLVQPGDGK